MSDSRNLAEFFEHWLHQPGKPLAYEQVKELVRENNRSKLPDELIIAVIFKESSFIPDARNESGASG